MLVTVKWQNSHQIFLYIAFFFFALLLYIFHELFFYEIMCIFRKCGNVLVWMATITKWQMSLSIDCIFENRFTHSKALIPYLSIFSTEPIKFLSTVVGRSLPQLYWLNFSKYKTDLRQVFISQLYFKILKKNCIQYLKQNLKCIPQLHLEILNPWNLQPWMLILRLCLSLEELLWWSIWW